MSPIKAEWNVLRNFWTYLISTTTVNLKAVCYYCQFNEGHNN